MSDSVRHQRNFVEHMNALFQNIDTMVYASEQACPYSKQLAESHLLGMHTFRTADHCEGCPLVGKFGFCSLMKLREIIGNHYEQHDIPTVELRE